MKYIKLISFLLLLQSSFAQSSNFGTLEILTTAFKATDVNSVVQIYFNNKLITSIQLTEKLVYKFYSKGRISITFVENTNRVSKVIDVSHDTTYYFLYGWHMEEKEKKINPEDWYPTKIGYELISKKQTSKIRVKNTVYLEEDIHNPVGEIPKTNAFKPGQGSGFLLNTDGYILTNYHVIDGAKAINISGINGEYNLKIKADLIAFDLQNDLALLKVNSSLIKFSSPPYSITKSMNTIQGNNVFALGYPIKEIMGSGIKVTNGIINSESGYKGSISQFQFSAAVQPGNSGGPLFNEKGEVVGIVTSKLNPEKIESVGYATKSDYIITFLNLIKDLKIEDLQKNEPTSITTLPLSEQIKLISNYIYIIETE